MWKKSTCKFWSVDKPEPTKDMYKNAKMRMEQVLIEAMGTDDLKFSEMKHHCPEIVEGEDGKYSSDWRNMSWALTLHCKKN